MRYSKIRSGLVTAVVVVALLCPAMGVGFAFADAGGNDIANATPMALPITGLTGSLESTTTESRDVFAITLGRGQTLEASMTVTSADTADTDFDMLLYAPGSTVIDDVNWTVVPRMWGMGWLHEHWTFMAADRGTYYLDVHAYKGSGDYILGAKIVPAVKFRIGSLSLPKSAKKGKKVKVSAVVTPAYNGYYSPVFFRFYRYEHGKYRRKAIKEGTGIRNPGEAKSKLSATYKFSKKGKWRVRAEFWDEAHSSKYTSYKYIKIR
ncbi:MAG TPA: hypothetical protein VIL41_06485 [Coriobacteriia bacterium]